MRHLRHVPTWLTYQYCLFFLLFCLLVDKIVCLHFLLLVFLLLWPNDQLANHLTADWSMDWPTDGQTEKQMETVRKIDRHTTGGQLMEFFIPNTKLLPQLQVFFNLLSVFLHDKPPYCAQNCIINIYQKQITLMYSSHLPHDLSVDSHIWHSHDKQPDAAE